ncbi:AsmA-like C-terminal region-containing protein [Variovorax guangxiensis]|uniref:Uncharacterized protein n=1 Tax=Variovorax guangxiensis TaxID=1775474 RepID=A0A502DXX2_9BURK|nr:AsmA-like C-terminal region-containing protein [Variovorax guangxiensis]RZI64462.1 MAG: hypothetical protein EOP79_14840 [Variovorax sp.]TPG25020.1 hypothetical protein EAH83_11390 [Variovorax ginsengisoli]TPG29272.1 hypothetical protein EAH82_11050 [Variovorax guangxiensis]
MKNTGRWVAGSVLAVVALSACVVAWWVPSDAELAARVGAEFEKSTGIGLKVGKLNWTLFPTARVVLEDVATVQDEPIRVGRLEINPKLRPLLSREIQVDSVVADGVALPRASVRAFRGRTEPSTKPTGNWTLAATPVQQVRFTELTWVDRRDIPLAYDGRVDFDPKWRPRTAEFSRHGVTPPARLRLEREGDADRWRTLVDVAGGTWNGTSELAVQKDDTLLLTAQLAPRNVDIEQLMKTFDRSAPVAGKVNGRSELRASGANVAELWRNATTRTRFAVQPATLTRFDLAKAIKSAGTSRGGRTPLDELTGTLDTEGTDDGMRFRYIGLKARSGLLTASGSATIYHRAIDGEVAVDIVDGVVGVPLKVSGSLDDPTLSLTGAALTGAAVGTAVLPGVGTAIGARIGQQVERLFGGDAKKPAPKGPRAP